MRRLNEHGVRSFWIYDVLYGIDNFARLARIAKEYDSEVIGTVFFSLSPVHTDEYLSAKAAKIAAVPEIDGVLFYDTAGVLDVDRMRVLVPKIIEAAHGKPVEFHANNLMGTSGLAYVEAVRQGISILHTATRPMANGPSVPSTESVVRNLELMGHTHGLDTSLLPPVAEHFRRVGRAAGYLVDQVSEYDLFNVTHQVPGGMLGTLRAQLVQHAMADRIEEVLAEAGTVLMSAPRAASIAANPPEQPTLDELRDRYGTRDDDLLILKALIPEADLEATLAAGPVRRDFPLVSADVEEVMSLLAAARTPYMRVATEAWDVELRRS